MGNEVDSTSKDEMKKTPLSIEDSLMIIARLVLIGGIISTIICLFTIVVVDIDKYEKAFNAIGFALTLGVLLFSLAIWASLRVLSNISVSLKNINSELKKK